jgi:hypothetical protein
MLISSDDFPWALARGLLFQKIPEAVVAVIFTGRGGKTTREPAGLSVTPEKTGAPTKRPDTKMRSNP